jgi:hypothetical protein
MSSLKSICLALECENTQNFWVKIKFHKFLYWRLILPSNLSICLNSYGQLLFTTQLFIVLNNGTNNNKFLEEVCN